MEIQIIGMFLLFHFMCRSVRVAGSHTALKSERDSFHGALKLYLYDHHVSRQATSG